MGSGASTLDVSAAANYSLKCYKYINGDGDYNFTCVKLDQGASHLEYISGTHNDLDRDVATVEEPTEQDESVHFEHTLSEEEKQTMLKYLNGEPSLVPNVRAKPSEAEVENARILGEELPDLDAPQEIEENHPLSNLTTSKDYVHIEIAGQFSGPPFRTLFGGILDESTLKSEQDRKKPDPIAVKRVRAVFKKTSSRGEMIVKSSVKKNSKALEWLKKERNLAAAAFNAAIVRPLSAGGHAVLDGASITCESIIGGMEKAGGAVATGAKTTGGAVAAGAKKTGEGVSKAAHGIAHGANEAKKKIASGAEAVGDRIASGASKVVEGVESAGAAVGKAVAVPVVAAGKGIEYAASKTVDGVAIAIDKAGLPAAARGIENAASAVGDGIKKTGEKIGDAGKAAGKAVGKGATSVKDGTKAGAKAVGSGFRKTGEAIGDGASAVGGAVGAFSKGCFDRFSSAMGAMKESTASSLDKLWAKSENQRKRAKAAFGTLMSKLEARHERQRQKVREKLEKERLEEEKRINERLEREKEEAKKALKEKLANAEKRLKGAAFALGKKIKEQKSREEKERLEKERKEMEAEVESVKKAMEDADKRLSAEKKKKKVKLMKKLREKQERKILRLLQQQEMEAKQEVDGFLAKELALSDINEQHSIEIRKMKLDHDALERRIYEEELAAYKADQDTVGAIKADFENAEEKAKHASEVRMAAAKKRATERIEETKQKRLAELARIEEEKRKALEAQIAAAEQAIREARLGEQATTCYVTSENFFKFCKSLLEKANAVNIHAS